MNILNELEILSVSGGVIINYDKTADILTILLKGNDSFSYWTDNIKLDFFSDSLGAKFYHQGGPIFPYYGSENIGNLNIKKEVISNNVTKYYISKI